MLDVEVMTQDTGREIEMIIEKEFVLREIAGDYILVPVGNTALDFNGLITVNELGAFLWQKLQKDVSVEDLMEEVLKEYEVDETTAREDIEEFIDSLRKSEIIK